MNFRKWLAKLLVRAARRIYPQSTEVMAFWADCVVEAVITGQSSIKVTHVPREELYAADDSQEKK